MADTQTQKPGVAGDGKIVRTHVALKSGNGTVSLEDYDEKVHGKALQETDEQYLARVNSRFNGVAAAAAYPPTTINNLQTIDSAKVVAATAPPLPPPVSRAPLEEARAVATVEQMKGSVTGEGDEKKSAVEALKNAPIRHDVPGFVTPVPGAPGGQAPNPPVNQPSGFGAPGGTASGGTGAGGPGSKEPPSKA